jgi:hypothetical protein
LQKPCQVIQILENFIQKERKLIILYITMNYDNATKQAGAAGKAGRKSGIYIRKTPLIIMVQKGPFCRIGLNYVSF